MKKKLIFGGTFNPVHNGHIFMLDVASKQINPDKTIIVPNNVPPHKDMVDKVSAHDRYMMCKIAFEKRANTIVSPMEIIKGGTTYTVDTLKELKNKDKSSELFFLIGADMFLSFHTWKAPTEISRYACLCVVPRNSTDEEILIKQKDYLKKKFNTNTILINSKCLDISSTQIRQIIKHNGKISNLVPKSIEDYIYQYDLYKRSKKC